MTGGGWRAAGDEWRVVKRKRMRKRMRKGKRKRKMSDCAFPLPLPLLFSDLANTAKTERQRKESSMAMSVTNTVKVWIAEWASGNESILA